MAAPTLYVPAAPVFPAGQQVVGFCGVGTGWFAIDKAGYVALTTDGGVTWTVRPQHPGTDPEYDTVEAILVPGSPSFIRLVVVGTVDDGDTDFVARSDDQGLTWTTITLPSGQPRFIKRFGTKLLAFSKVIDVQMQVDVSTDYGVTWTQVLLPTLPDPDSPMHVAITTADVAVIFGFDVYTFWSTNGTVWTRGTNYALGAISNVWPGFDPDADVPVMMLMGSPTLYESVDSADVRGTFGSFPYQPPTYVDGYWDGIEINSIDRRGILLMANANVGATKYLEVQSAVPAWVNVAVDGTINTDFRFGNKLFYGRVAGEDIALMGANGGYVYRILFGPPTAPPVFSQFWTGFERAVES